MNRAELQHILTDLLTRATEPFQFQVRTENGIQIWVIADPVKKTWRSQLYKEPGIGLAPRPDSN